MVLRAKTQKLEKGAFFRLVLPFPINCLLNLGHNGGANMLDYDCILPLQTTTLSIVGESWHAKAVCKRGES
jgi:hypothetical protein